jgi:membrane protein
MARMKDLAPVFRRIGFVGLCKRVWQQCHEDGVFPWASALAYSWLFAIFPFFLFLLSLVPYMPKEGKIWIDENLAGVFEKALPRDAYKTIWENYLKVHIDTLLNSKPTGFLTMGLVLAVWGASGGIAMTCNALDKCYDVDRPRPFYRVRSLAIMLTVIEAVLILAVVILLPIATTLKRWTANILSNMEHPLHVPYWAFWVFDISRYVLALACMFSALALLYYFGPRVRQRFRIFSPGAVFSVVVWLLLGSLFRIYVNHFANGKYEQTYGPVGGVVILLLFFYLDAVVLLIGAEINSEIDYVALNLKPGDSDFRGTPWAHEENQSKPEEPRSHEDTKSSTAPETAS